MRNSTLELRESFLHHCKSNYLGKQTRFDDEVESTNDSCRSDENLRHGFLWSAGRQTKGKGSNGRSWSSSSATDLYFSIVLHAKELRFEQDAFPLGLLSIATGWACMKSLAHTYTAFAGLAASFAVKWPNDVWWIDAPTAGRKCAGILIESSSRGAELDRLVVGVGINVNREHFDGALEQSACSLRQLLEEKLPLTAREQVDRGFVLAQFCCFFEEALWLLQSNPDGAQQLFSESLAFRNEMVSIDQARGRFVGLNAEGHALLESDTLRAFHSGTLRPV